MGEVKLSVKKITQEGSKGDFSLLPYDIFPGCKCKPVKGDLRNVLTVKPWRPYALARIPSRVLTEEDYVDILERIIQRDFFPDLPLLWACERLDRAKLQGELPRKIKELEQHVKDIYTQRQEKITTPVFRLVTLQDGRELKIDLTKLGLKEFQDLFTSEDNASFEKLVTKEKMKLAIQQMWIEKSAAAQNLESLQVSAALTESKRPASLLYSYFSARNPLMLPITTETAGVMGLFPKTDSCDLLTLTLPSPPLLSATNEVEIITTNTRLHDEENFLEAMYHKQVAKQQVTCKNESENALFDEMVEKGVYSVNALVDIHVVDTLLKKKKRQINLSSEELSQIQSLKSGIKTPTHKGYQFLHTPIAEQTSFNKSISCTPQRKDSNFIIPDPSHRELTARRLCDKASRRTAAEKLKNKSNCIREVLKATGTPLTRTMTPMNVFYKNIDLSRATSQTSRLYSKKLRVNTTYWCTSEISQGVNGFS